MALQACHGHRRCRGARTLREFHNEAATLVPPQHVAMHRVLRDGAGGVGLACFEAAIQLWWQFGSLDRRETIYAHPTVGGGNSARPRVQHCFGHTEPTWRASQPGHRPGRRAISGFTAAVSPSTHRSKAGRHRVRSGIYQRATSPFRSRPAHARSGLLRRNVRADFHGGLQRARSVGVGAINRAIRCGKCSLSRLIWLGITSLTDHGSLGGRRGTL